MAKNMQFQGIACFYINVRLKKVSYNKLGRSKGNVNFRVSKIAAHPSTERFTISFNGFDKKIV